ncbi:MAG: glycosyltransferase family 1 protein [Acidobacteriaceae bacterium]|nr:glycosyltransferase family 1 protein [Acidobacteriaceae bacterium]
MIVEAVARIVLNTFGSFGDLHPYLAIAIELRRRDHDPVIATSEVYRAKIQAEGIGFSPVRPDVGELLERPDIIEKVWHPLRGPEYLIRDYLMPRVEQAYEDLSAGCAGADLLLTHPAAYAGPTVAEVLKLPWISVVPQPSIFLSADDPPVLPPAWLRHVYRLGRGARVALFAMGKARVRRWGEPLLRLRKRLGLSTAENPIFEGSFSPCRTLALFSRQFASPQPDWPKNVLITGFVFYDRRGEGFARYSPHTDEQVTAELARFLDTGPPPVVFTLGSSAVMHPGTFYRESLKLALKLRVRAVLLAGAKERAQLPNELPQSVFVADYAPYSKVLPRAALTVHQGGIGTTAQALRAGRPMLVVPWSHDQPDNAERLKRLGVARWVNRNQYTAEKVIGVMRELLDNSCYAERAAELSERIRAEDGLQTACNAIEAALKGENTI